MILETRAHSATQSGAVQAAAARLSPQSELVGNVRRFVALLNTSISPLHLFLCCFQKKGKKKVEEKLTCRRTGGEAAAAGCYLTCCSSYCCDCWQRRWIRVNPCAVVAIICGKHDKRLIVYVRGGVYVCVCVIWGVVIFSTVQRLKIPSVGARGATSRWWD